MRPLEELTTVALIAYGLLLVLIALSLLV